ncbi:MBL fold metallo-hydrolase [Mycobacterium sp. CBMA271]|uniref:MBL fold metallo-hydrolase n=1 Tax=unclassified Mycobacteroides TaxID=2618759 RepID=UPI0012DEDBE0|nr:MULTISPECIES: MBL fold metallo-hydrolase [unclassified Mycobacteroides]MUM17772.1 Zn-dependent hydrolase [Mycobacteroides sp. CBMA 326]MUM22954.1 MBL fold metallo-hydrolase [Mycobacteroides sp. CBMA 271]
MTSITIDDNYSGHIEPGSGVARRTVDGATIIKASVGPMDNNAYIVTCANTGKSLLIDAANDAERLATLLDENAPNIELIVTTHQHFDHWQALEAIVGKTQSSSAAHDLDAGPLPVRPTTLLSGGDSFAIGDLHFDVIHLRGHTPGSVALAFTASGVTHLFTGDSLFPGGVGKTFNPGDFDQLLDDVRVRLFGAYSDSTVVYPGHGDDTTLGAERGSLGEWRERGW